MHNNTRPHLTTSHRHRHHQLVTHYQNMMFVHYQLSNGSWWRQHLHGLDQYGLASHRSQQFVHSAVTRAHIHNIVQLAIHCSHGCSYGHAHAVIDHVYELMENEHALQRHYLPLTARATEPRSFMFATADWQTNRRLLVLLHGSGYVRAGLWARSLVVNDSLDWGTQLPYIQRAIERGMAVLVMNTNLNKATDINGNMQQILHNEAPDRHALYVWKHFVSKAAAKDICIVAHSAGGYVTVELAKQYATDFESRVTAVAFTDAAYSAPRDPNPGWEHLRKVGCDWVCSIEPAGRPVEWFRPSATKLKIVSAGTTDHARSSQSAIDSIWTYFDEKLPNLSAATSKANAQIKSPDLEDDATEEKATESHSETLAAEYLVPEPEPEPAAPGPTPSQDAQEDSAVPACVDSESVVNGDDDGEPKSKVSKLSQPVEQSVNDE